MFGNQLHLDIEICEDGKDASDKGHVYHDGYKAVEISKVVVVKNGTNGGNSTVDIVLRDQDGNKFVVMITGNLLKTIPTFSKSEDLSFVARIDG